MPTSKKKLDYINKFNKETYRQVNLHIHRVKEKDMCDFLDTKSSINGYIKNLIRNDMNRAK